MGFYRKRPVVIEAIRFVGSNFADVIEFTGYKPDFGSDQYHDTIVIETLEGDMEAHAGDWIIRGVKGELYPCRNDIFAETYEAVDNEVVT